MLRHLRRAAIVAATALLACLGTPSKVRVAVVGYYDENPDIVDWAPGEERLYPWVNR